MANKPSANDEDKGELTDIKRKLVWRMAFAVLMIVALLGGLAAFDYFSHRQFESESAGPQFNEPVPVAKKNATQPVTPIEAAPEVKTVEEKPAEPEATAAPVDKSAPKVDLPQRPEVAARPTLPRASTSAASGPRAAAPTAAPAPAVRASEGRTGGATAATSGAPIRAERAEQVPPPVPARLYSGFAVQAGVFADPRRAEELHAKLTLEGIPSTIEARVQAGPFKTREEAEAAREKLKALGIDAVLLPPRGARR